MSTHESASPSPAPPGSTPPPAGESQPGEQSANTTTQTPSNQQQGGNLSPFAAPAVEECLQAVQRFRGGEYSQEEAIYRVFDALGNSNQPTAIIFQAARPYIEMLDSILAQQRGAEEHGRVVAGAHLPGPTDYEAEPQPEVRTASSAVAHKCHHAELDDSDDDDEHRERRCPLDLSSLPWMQNVKAIPLPQSLEDTQGLLVLFSQDPKRWKMYFINEPNCPQFPNSEWTNIILGRPVNLDLVIASMFNVTLEQKHKERLGRVSFSLNDVAPSRVIKSQGDWLSAWKATSDAVAFIFRHRRDELDHYSSYMLTMFTSVLEANHARVLCYDKAIRLRTSSHRDVLLTDVYRFNDLHMLCVKTRS
ncbi:hypothetical protein EWM64_g3433 [Hericium alpestre]|uniref:Uncharacterized protein n=1 Tax=Hericium alpestre TaxID=135208 RepID=A0A4Z0A3Y4_9AGAM|nr:hypothetical protein EWM64_g3433 [Hericium alpestre]